MTRPTRALREQAAQLCSAMAYSWAMYMKFEDASHHSLGTFCQTLEFEPPAEMLAWNTFTKTPPTNFFVDRWALASAMLMTGEVQP